VITKNITRYKIDKNGTEKIVKSQTRTEIIGKYGSITNIQGGGSATISLTYTYWELILKYNTFSITSNNDIDIEPVTNGTQIVKIYTNKQTETTSIKFHTPPGLIVLSSAVSAMDLTELADYLNYLDVGFYYNVANLDFTALTELRTLRTCSLSHQTLDVSGLTKLHRLDTGAVGMSTVPITSINIEGCENLHYLILSSNSLQATAINTIFTALPDHTGTAWAGVATVNVRNNPGAATCDLSIATNKGWNVTNT